MVIIRSFMAEKLGKPLEAGEIPLGIIASFFGTLLFIIMMLSKNIRVQR